MSVLVLFAFCFWRNLCHGTCMFLYLERLTRVKIHKLCFCKCSICSVCFTLLFWFFVLACGWTLHYVWWCESFHLLLFYLGNYANLSCFYLYGTFRQLSWFRTSCDKYSHSKWKYSTNLVIPKFEGSWWSHFSSIFLARMTSRR